jgi:hypothetical protein
LGGVEAIDEEQGFGGGGERERRLILVPDGSGGRLDSFSALSRRVHETSRVFLFSRGLLALVGPGGLAIGGLL